MSQSYAELATEVYRHPGVKDHPRLKFLSLEELKRRPAPALRRDLVKLNNAARPRRRVAVSA